MFLLSTLSAESKKETNSLRSLRLSGNYKLSNYNTIPYLKIHVLRVLQYGGSSTIFFGIQNLPHFTGQLFHVKRFLNKSVAATF